MTTFNPADWPRLPDWLDPHERRRNPQGINRERSSAAAWQ